MPGQDHHASSTLADAAVEGAGIDSGSAARNLRTGDVSGDPVPSGDAAGVARADYARLGRFVILSRLGRGGMGEVFAAYDPSLDRKVALKVLKPRGDDDEAVRARIVREAQAMAKLNHPNVAQVFEVGEHEGAMYVVMELVRGETLRRWRSSARRSNAEILEVYVQAARGLAAAHAAGLVHRDFKPDNAMIGVDGRVRVLDFGLVRALPQTVPATVDLPHAEGDGIVTRADAIVGTPTYMAPEQLLGEAADARADQFSFCVALWEALVGERPFGATHGPRALEAALAGQIGPPPPDAKVSPAILATLRRGLARDRDARHGDMTALVEALLDDPARRRRRRTFVALGAGAIAASAVVWQVQASQRVAACESEATAIDTTWNATTRESVRNGLLATGLAHAEAIATRAESGLDDWAKRWSSARASSCRAATVDRTRDARLAARANECLAEGREAFAALTDVLATADVPVLHATASAIVTLPDPLDCDDDRVLGRMPADASDASSEAGALRQRLAVSAGLAAIARASEALAIAEDVQRRAAALSLPYVEALAYLRIARARSLGGDYDGALQAARAGLDLAMRNGDDDELTFEAMLATMEQLGEHGEIDHAMWYADLAKALLARIDDHDGLRQAHLLTAIAYARRARLQFDDDLALLDQAQATFERVLGPDHPTVASGLGSIAAIYKDQGELRRAEALFRRALEIRERVFGPEHPLVAKALNNLGSTLGLLGEHERARQVLEQALDVWARTLGPDHPESTLALDNLAYLHYVAGDFAGATPLVERSLAILQRTNPGQPTVAQTMGNLARLHLATGNLDRADALLGEAIAILESALGKDHFSTASAVATLGEVARARGDHRAAAAHFERALALYGKGGTDQRWFAETRFDLAQALWAAGDRTGRPLTLVREAIAGYRTADGAEPALLATFEAWAAEHASAG